ncbi:hypothetical protein CKAN_01608200 [Cinnamomum micranthum f. kanehirae]|uniref:Pentatricopeptide repeat-containing protein n=1 Tax=Cinnamomum micranthum f. kanehirae TaxID=337451 RepID=A0A3S3N862_9MAGN|nr:hypothetical protein CKAN_01608200 [Cinnamomum micranthum f. kanehirae]
MKSSGYDYMEWIDSRTNGKLVEDALLFWGYISAGLDFIMLLIDVNRSRMKPTRSLLNVFSHAPFKSTPISLSPFPTLPTLDPMSKLKSGIREIRTSLYPFPTLPTETPISKLNYDEDHHLQEIKYPLKTDRPEEPYFQMLMTMYKTNPPKKTPIPPEQLYLPSFFVPFLRRGGQMIRTTGPSLKINSQIPPKSMPPISLSLSPSPTLSTQTPIFNTNRPFKAKVPPLTRMEYAHEYGIAVEINQDFRTMLEDGSPIYRNLALTLLFEDDMFDVAMAVYGDMLKRNFPRDCMTFNCVIDGLCKAGKMQDAIHLFDEMAAEIGGNHGLLALQGRLR